MPGGNKNIKPSDNPKPFGTPEGNKNANKNGRPKKVYSNVIDEQKKKGYKVPSKDEFYEAIGLLFVMDEDDLTEFSTNKENPHALRRIAIDLESDKFRAKLHSEYRDWLFGKATAKIVTEDEEGNTKPISGQFLGKEILDALKKKEEE